MSDLSKEANRLADGFAMGESPRWHNGQLWLSDWGAQEIVTLDLDGQRAATLAVPFPLPFCFDWHTDGSLLVVAGRHAGLMKQSAAGVLVQFADLSAISTGPWNEIVVDATGHAYVNSADAIAVVSPEGAMRKVSDGGALPNGMAITPDNRTLLLAESQGQCITAFDIASDSSLSNRRTWAGLSGYPDGICLDADGALWYADVPNKHCLRIREGGEILDVVSVDRGCFSCALGGHDGKTLFVVATEWRGMDQIAEVAAEYTGQVFAVTAPASAAGWRPTQVADRGELAGQGWRTAP